MVMPTVGLLAFRFKQLWPYRKVILFITVIALATGLIWDYFAAKTKIWGWQEDCCSLPRLWDLPIEEFLFITLAAIYISSFTITLRQVLKKG